ncbi:GspH/FimT family pseudopilin [Dyella sp.]|jgi:type IV fimbrial biogenesis protein FimT|uniref:GspH/FimT family pseudopilin n=1 Tax=Dyella sp. TaxID=1869338 RepID=UPI002D7A3EC7|nr:GspH/FimT family pseudopilin [Dyella sp.]HET6432141.1 GspH/FimT family pseudopilin [Dyella sp.]
MQDGKGHRYRGHRAQAGVTLIEQIMALAVVAIVASIAAPSLGGLMARSRLQSMQTDFIAGLNHARLTAVTRGVTTVFCPTDDGQQCNGSNVWSGGWLVGEDRDADGQPDGRPLYAGSSMAKHVVVRSGTGRYRVRFHADGTAPGSNLTITLCSPDNRQPPLNVVVSNAGRIRGAPASGPQAAACRGAG